MLLRIEMGSLSHDEILAMRYLEKLWDQAGNPILEIVFAVILREAIEEYDSGAAGYPDALPRVLRDIEQGRFRFRFDFVPN
jgi:hypothetical protein